MKTSVHRLAVVATFVASSAAAAEQVGSGDVHAAAKRLHDEAVAAYEAGDAEAALRGFEQAYALEPDPVLLYNQAQSHRKLGRRESAIRLYRRFLEQVPQTDRRAQVEARIAELSRDPRAATRAPAAPAAATAAPVPPVAAVDARASASEPAQEGASAWHARVAGVAAQPSFSVRASDGRPWRQSPIAGAELGLSRAIALGEATAVELGIAATFTAVPYTHQTQDVPARVSTLWGGYAEVGVRRRLAERWTAALGGGAGVELWSGLADGNPFTRGGSAVAAMALPSFRGRIALELQISPRWLAFVAPCYVFSIAPSDATSAIEDMRRLQLSLGVAHRF